MVNSMSKITDFYTGVDLDQHGRTLLYILYKDNKWWEDCHDHIQWVFPTNKPSKHNPLAPLLTPEDIAEFRSNSYIQGTARISFYRFLDFLGLRYDRSNNIVYAGPEFCSLLPEVWLTPNHNHLRITRCLEFLGLVGIDTQMVAFYKFLKNLKAVFNADISDETFAYWTTEHIIASGMFR